MQKSEKLFEDMEINVSGRLYLVDALVDFRYDPGCIYDSWGDPGREPELSFTFEIVHAVDITDDHEFEVDARDFGKLEESVEQEITSRL